MTYHDKKNGFARALALGVAMMGFAGAASASSIHVLLSDGRVLLTETETGDTSLVNKIDPLAGTESNENFSPNSLGFFDGTFYATTFNNDGDEIIYRFNDSTASGGFEAGKVSTGNVSAFAAGDANADGFSVVDGAGTFTSINFDPFAKGTTSEFTDNPSTFGDIAFDTFNPGVTFASYTSGSFTGLEKFVGGASVDAKSVFDRYVGLAFDEFGQLFGVAAPGDIFALDFDAETTTVKGTISLDVLGGAQVTDAASVSPIPLPAAGWLMLAGLGGLAALRRRKRAA